MRIVLTLAFCLLLALAPLAATAATASADTLDATSAAGDLTVAGVCVWGFADDCVVPAYECFRPDRPMFGIGCI